MEEVKTESNETMNIGPKVRLYKLFIVLKSRAWQSDTLVSHNHTTTAPSEQEKEKLSRQ